MMPIDYRNYPPDWKQISLARRQAAGWRCEFCGAAHGQSHPETGSKVILTVAHLNHDTGDNSPANLRALCQRCHNRHDQPHRTKHAAETRRRKRTEAGQLDLFFVCTEKKRF